MQKVSLILILFLIITGASANRPHPPKETLKWLTLAEAEILRNAGTVDQNGR